MRVVPSLLVFLFIFALPPLVSQPAVVMTPFFFLILPRWIAEARLRSSFKLTESESVELAATLYLLATPPSARTAEGVLRSGCVAMCLRWCLCWCSCWLGWLWVVLVVLVVLDWLRWLCWLICCRWRPRVISPMLATLPLLDPSPLCALLVRHTNVGFLSFLPALAFVRVPVGGPADGGALPLPPAL